MKFMHLGDLHIGKRINEMSMLEDQKYILDQILDIMDREGTESVLIAGDIYDKNVPSAESVALFDEFITQVHKKHIKIFMVSGNHDSAERINYGSRLLEDSGIYIAGQFDGMAKKIPLNDCCGNINIWLVPFIKPAMVKNRYPDCDSYEDAFSSIIKDAGIDFSERNVLVAHQFFTGGEKETERSESEVINAGTLDNIDISCIKDFDYVALGHIHRPQGFNEGRIRYSGSLLKYSFSESRHVKSVPIVELKEKGEISVELKPLEPLRDMRIIEGPIDRLLSKEVYSQGNCDDYIKAVLTDEEELYDAIGRMREVYPNVMRLEFKNSRTDRASDYSLEAKEVENKTNLQLFEEFFEKQNNRSMSEEERNIISMYLEDE